jgi:DNA-binding CsgD family transcriptional regulator
MTTPPHRNEADSFLCPSIVGRDVQLAQLQRIWADAGQVALVRGAAGIGKSRLVREFADGVRDAGGVVLVGRCSPTASDVPFRPVREALLSASRSGLRPSSRLAPFVPALASLVPEWSETHDTISDGGAIVLAEAMLRVTTEWATSDAPVLLVVEDVQWADLETLTALEYLADNVAEHPLLVILTLRDSEPGPGTELADRLLARRVAQPIALHPLRHEQIVEMVHSCPSGSSLAPKLVETIVTRSDGIPFFVEELLATTVENSVPERLVPMSIGVAIETRLEGLPAPVVQFLRYAAVLGRQFDWHLVAAALRCPLEAAIDCMRLATRAQLIDHHGGGFRFRHALTVEAVRSSLLPEEVQGMSAALLATLDSLHPDFDSDICQLAATLAASAGDGLRSADLWLVAAERALTNGWLGSAEALALRAHSERSVQSDRLLLSTWALAGQPHRALEAGQRILVADIDEALRTEVRFDLLDAMIAAGRWADAESYLKALRSVGESNRAHESRCAVAEAEIALSHNDRDTALSLARSALDNGRLETLPEISCRALWVIGRVERARDTGTAAQAFAEAYECAVTHKLSLERIKSQQELATIDMYETLATEKLDEVRRDALAAGALSITAMIDLALAATYSCRGQVEETLAAAKRCEDISRRFDLASLPMSLAIQAVVHGLSGDRETMTAAARAARATGGDRTTVEMTTMGNGAALFHLGTGNMPGALDALDQAMAMLRAAGGGAHEFPGRWALVRTVVDKAGSPAREEARTMAYDTAMGRATLWAADAVAAGREGGDANTIFRTADDALARFEGGFLRSIARLLVAPCAHADGWGDPAPWLREALANFEDLGLSNFAGQCRTALRSIGEPVPRRTRREDRANIPAALAAYGITPRELEILAHVASRRTNRQIAGALHLSVRTVEKHVERLTLKTGRSRTELGPLADSAGVSPAI